jgi:hypothetical protein
MAKQSRAVSRNVGVFVCVVLFGVAGYLTYKTLFMAPPPTAQPIKAEFMCSETGKVFTYEMHAGEHWPVLSPYSGKMTGYPAERCYWTKDGKRKLTPTYVILNEHLGKPGDTICPECGRVVVGHNPPPPAEVPLAAPETGTQPDSGKLAAPPPQKSTSKP